MDLIAVHPEQAQLLKDIGVVELYWGLETWNPETAKAIKKGGSIEQKIKGLKTAKECWGDDVLITAGIVIGLPKDTVQSLNEVVQWYIDEGHNYIQLFTFWPLSLRAPSELNEYIFTSEIEDNLEKFGYTVPNDSTWARQDEGDITSKEQADKLMLECNKKIQPYLSFRREIWDLGKFEYIGAFKTRTDIVHNFITIYYFPKLMETLREQSSKISLSSSIV